jgi:thymidylate synthase
MEREELNIELSNSTMIVDKFNDGYFDLHKHLVNNGEKISSRNGNTIEILNFKTEIKNPLSRCIGGKSRNVNIFFLLAEALHIWAGRRDVKFLKLFNSQIAEYSDDGVYFHAPYGFRLRNYGVHPMIVPSDSNKHSLGGGIDQIQEIISILTKFPEDRRAVAQIWNPEFDLGVSSKDIPCNDMLMFKVRDNKLHITIQNRSNDLDWGLCTNVFQFSFILEIMARIMNFKVGTQVHNSQSLHIYDWNKLTQDIENDNSSHNLYDNANTPTIDFEFGEITDPIQKLEIADFWIKSMISNLLLKIDNKVTEDGDHFKDNLFVFSEFLYLTYSILEIYIRYKNKELSRHESIQSLYKLHMMKIAYKSDYLILALNFFVLRYENSDSNNPETNELISKIRTEVDANIGKY